MKTMEILTGMLEASKTLAEMTAYEEIKARLSRLNSFYHLKEALRKLNHSIIVFIVEHCLDIDGSVNWVNVSAYTSIEYVEFTPDE